MELFSLSQVMDYNLRNKFLLKEQNHTQRQRSLLFSLMLRRPLRG